MKEHERTYLPKLEAIRTNSIIHRKSSTYIPLHIQMTNLSVAEKTKFIYQILMTLQGGNLTHLANLKINRLSQQQIPVKVPCRDGTCMKTPCTKLFFGFQIFFCAFVKIKLIFSTYFKQAYSFVEIIYPAYIYQQKNSDRSVMRGLALDTSTAAVRLF